jgi:hypothetical protein
MTRWDASQAGVLRSGVQRGRAFVRESERTMYLIVDFRGFVNTNGPQQTAHPYQDLRLYHREKLINRFRLLGVQFSGRKTLSGHKAMADRQVRA